MKLSITEYTTWLGNLAEKRKAYLHISEFDVGNAIKKLITAKGSILVGSAAGTFVELLSAADGMVISYKASEAGGLKAISIANGTVTMTNRSGVSVIAGSPVILDSANASSFKTTTIVGDRRVFGVTGEAIADLATGGVVVQFVETTVAVTGAVGIGQWLVSSATAGRAKGSTYTKPPGSIGVATSINVSGNGTVTAILNVDFYIGASSGKGYLQGNSAASTLNQVLSFITEIMTGATALPGNNSTFMGLASGTIGYLFGPTAYKTPFATDTPAACGTANSPNADAYMGTNGTQNATKGIAAGTYIGGCTAYAYRLLFSNETTTYVPGANLSVARYTVSAVTDTANGYFLGGYTTVLVATTDKTNFAAETTAAVAGANLTAARRQAATFSNVGVAGYAAGGFEAAKTAKCDKVTYASDTTAALAGMGTAIASNGGLSGATFGVSCGGSNGPSDAAGITTASEKMSFSTETFSVLATATLPTPQCNMASMSTLT